MHTVDWEQANLQAKIFSEIVAERLVNLSIAGFEEDEAGLLQMNALNKLCQWAGNCHDYDGPFDGMSQYIFSDVDYSVLDPSRVQRDLSVHIYPELLDAFTFDGACSLEERVDNLKDKLHSLRNNGAFSHSKDYMFQKQLHYQELCEWSGEAVNDLFVGLKYASSPTRSFKR